MQLVLLLFLAAGLTPQQHFDRAAERIKAADWRGAEVEYRAGIAKAPHIAEAHNNLGSVYFELNDPRSAVRAFQEAVRLKPQAGEFRFNLGLALFRSNEAEAALKHLALAGAPEAKYLAGICNVLLDRWPAAVAEFEAARKLGKLDPELWYLLIKGYRKVGRGDDGMKAFVALAARYPESEFVHRLLAEASEAANDFVAAEREFRQALEKSPDSPDLRFGLGYLLWRQKRWQEASEHLNAELALNPHSARALYYLGDIALKQDNASAALQLFERAARAEPEWQEVSIGLGQAALKLGRMSDAEKYLRKAANDLPDRVEPRYWLGQLLQRTGRPGEAHEQMQAVKRLHAAEHRRERQLLSRPDAAK